MHSLLVVEELIVSGQMCSGILSYSLEYVSMFEAAVVVLAAWQ